MTTTARPPADPPAPVGTRRVAGRHPGLLTSAQVAAQFGVSPTTVAVWAQQGRLPYVRTIGGHRRYPAAAIAELVAASTNTAGEPGTASGTAAAVS